MSEEPPISASDSPEKSEVTRSPLRVYVDDVRETPEPGWVLIRTTDAALRYLKYCKDIGSRIDLLSLDHDMGIDFDTGEDITTRPIVEWMIENDYWPDIVLCHSANPYGRKWVENMVERYAPGGFRYQSSNE